MDDNPSVSLIDLYSRLKRRGNWMIIVTMLVLLALAVFSSPARRTPLPIPRPENRLGIHLLLDDGRNAWPEVLWPEHIEYAAHAAGKWGFVTQLIRADDLDVEKWQLFMDLCAEHELIPIIRLATTFDRTNQWWIAPTPDGDGSYSTIAQQYASFLAQLEWPSELHYVIVGNEPNHGNEWSGRPDASAYAKFLIDTAKAIHAADPNTRVMSAPLDNYTPHTGEQPFSDGLYYVDSETFLDTMIAAQPEVFTHIDAWASHTYPPDFSVPPWEQTFQIDYLNGASNPRHRQPPDNIPNRGINGYRWELWKLSTYGVRPLPVFITETGWRHAESAYADSLDYQENLLDAATVATYFDLALHGNNGRYPDLPQEGWTPWLDDPRVYAVTPFALNGLPAEWGHTNWLILDDAGTVLDTYDILAQEE